LLKETSKRFRIWFLRLRQSKNFLLLSWWRHAKEKINQPTFKIHVFPSGRLGNQLFQASLADQLAHEASKKGLNSTIYWHLTQRSDPNFLSDYPFCKFEFKSHPIYVQLFSDLNLNQSPIYARFCYKLWRKFIIERHKLIPERFAICETFQFSSKSVAIIYPHQEFKFVRQEFLKEIIDFADEKSRANAPKSDRKGIESVAVHLRFGDFQNAEVIQEYGRLGIDYYLGAVNGIRGLPIKGEVIWRIFTDDYMLARKTIESLNLENVQFARDLDLSDFDELIYFSKHDVLILSNSTYSWWAGYLARGKSKVIAPKPLTLKPHSSLAVNPAWILTDAYFERI